MSKKGDSVSRVNAALLIGRDCMAHANGSSDAKCRIPSLPLNVIPPKFNYIHVGQ